MENKRFTVGIDSDMGVFESDILKAVSRLGQLGKAAIRASMDMSRGLGSGSTNAIASLTRVGSSVKDQEEAFRRATAAAGRFYDASGRLREANGRFVGMGGGLKKAFEDPFSALDKLVLKFYSLDKALELAKQGLQIISDFQRMDTALKTVSTSATDFAHSQAFLGSTADQYGLSIEALSKSFVGFKANTNDTILQGAEAERIFLSVAKASAALQLSAEDTTGTLRAFGQMLSKGTVQSEELKGQVGERLYGAFNTAAKAMGVTTMELNKMLQSGDVLATDLLPKLATELEKSFGAAAQSNVTTMAGGFTRATDQLKLFISEFAKTAGIDSFFAKIGNGIADTIRDLRKAQKGGLQNELDAFYALSPDQRKARMSELGGMINRAQAELNTRTNLSPTSEGLQREATLQKKIEFMRQLYGQMYMAVKEDAKATSKAQIKAVDDPITYLEKKKDRFKYLTDLKAGLGLQGKSLTAADAKELVALTKQLQDVGVKKAPAVKLPSQPALTTNERLLKRLTYQLKEYGDTADHSLSRQVALLEKAVEQEKKLLDVRQVLAGIDVKPIDVEKRQMQRGFSPDLFKIPERVGFSSLDTLGKVALEAANRVRLVGTAFSNLRSRIEEVKKYGSLEFLYDQVDKIRLQIGKLSLKGKIISQEDFNILVNYLSALRKAEAAQQNEMDVASGMGMRNEIQTQPSTEKWFSFEGIANNWGDTALANLAKNRDRVIGSAKDMTAAIQNVLQQGAAQGAEAMASFIGGLIAGTANISDLPKIILGTVADTLQNLAQALAASAAIMLFVPGLQGQAAAQLAGAAGLFAVAGLARSLAKPKQQAVAMAAGAYVTGPTASLTGEYPGAELAGRGEFVAPANKGAAIIADNLMKMGFGSGGGDELVTRISGSDLEVVLVRNAAKKRALGGRS